MTSFGAMTIVQHLIPARARRRRAAVLTVSVALVLAGAIPAAAAVPAASGAPAAPGHDGGKSQLQRDVDAIRDAGVIGVLAEARTPRGRVVARSGVGDLRTGRPVPYGAYFRMGSNGKTFVATVVLQLVAEGRLSLDDTVERWLPGVVTGNGNDGSKITVRRLLQHTSGLANYTDFLPGLEPSPEAYRAHRFDRYRPEQLVAIAMEHPPGWVPGPGDTRWSYSNTNYILAGMIIERVTGNDWPSEVRDRILRPLGLRHTFEPGQSAFLPRPHARGYEQYTADGPPVDTTVLNHSWGGAAGSLVTTTADLTRFWQALLGGRLLRPAQLAQMRTTVDAPAFHPVWPGARYGLGIIEIPVTCGRSKTSYWGHGGDTLGYSTRNGFSSDGRRGVVLSLSSHTGDQLAVEAAAVRAVQHTVCGAAGSARPAEADRAPVSAGPWTAAWATRSPGSGP
jgi:D-alanyl-D-alanine carboxypeptidase